MECLTGETKWPQFIREHFSDIRAPFTAGIELLAECNFRCIHCYAESERSRRNLSMTTDQILQMIDTLVDHNCIELFLTGGEVLLHKDFFEIYRYAKQKGLLVSVLSNGSLICQEHIDLWKEYPPEIVSVTMYGATEDTYEQITKCKNGYRLFCKGVRLLKENDIPFEIKCIGMKQNLHEINQIRKFSKSLGLNKAVLAWDIRPMNDGNLQPIHCRVNPEEAYEFEIQDEERKEFWDQLALDEGRHMPTIRQKQKMLYPCSIAYQFVFITHDGYMQGCVKAVKPRYNLLLGDFDTGWEFLGNEFVKKKASENFKCLTCKKFRYCGQCTAAFVVENGDPEKPVDFYCEFGELMKQYMEKGGL